MIDLLRDIGLLDLVDIGVVAVLAWVGLRLVRRTRARPALLGLATLGEVSFPLFYLNYNLYPRENPWRDAIGNAVRFFKGVEYTISRPRDLWFAVSDGEKKVPVHYRGAIPDAFKEGLEVVVDGRMGSSGTFEGRELIVKCPSKYESQGSDPRTGART